jgi:glutamyl/glutaminyl-tRNA synthetase
LLHKIKVIKMRASLAEGVAGIGTVMLHHRRLQLPRGLRTRFAPSPTGYLHLGHVAAAVYVWGLAQAAEAEVHVRIEDHDRQRCRPEYTAALVEDLIWLGFLPGTARVEELSTQSQHPERYAAALAVLDTQELVYACTCSRRQQIERLASPEPLGEVRYDGYCRDRKQARYEAGLRLKLAPETHGFDDLFQGPQSQCPSKQCGDLLVFDRHQNWTYNFCVVVDDDRERIDMVIRGLDLIEATGRQLQLAKLLGATSPRYWLHHPLILAEDGRKLSKRFGSSALRTLRDQGHTSQDVLGMAARAVGLISSERPLEVSSLGELFS